MAASRVGKDGKPGGAKRKRKRPSPPARVVLPAGMMVEDAVRIRGQDAVWCEIGADGSAELWFPDRAS